MLHYLFFKKEINRLYKRKRKIEKAYQSEIEAAYEQQKKANEIESIKSCAYHEVKMIDEEISLIVTDYWLKVSNKHFLPLPSAKENDMWDECTIMSKRRVLTNTGVTKIRNEFKDYKEGRFNMELKVIAAITGMVGAVTGLLAIILSK